MSDEQASPRQKVGPGGRDGESAVERELRPTLERATETLRSALSEACGTNIDRVDTGELIRVEEVLAIANEAAKSAIAVRRRLRDVQRPAQNATAPATDRAPRLAESEASRTITDATGRAWRVFAVRPSTARGRFVVRQGFADGWLCFDAGSETRRLAPIPDRWHDLSDETLRQLWARADIAHPRRRSSDVRSDDQRSNIPEQRPADPAQHDDN